MTQWKARRWRGQLKDGAANPNHQHIEPHQDRSNPVTTTRDAHKPMPIHPDQQCEPSVVTRPSPTPDVPPIDTDTTQPPVLPNNGMGSTTMVRVRQRQYGFDDGIRVRRQPYTFDDGHMSSATTIRVWGWHTDSTTTIPASLNTQKRVGCT